MTKTTRNKLNELAERTPGPSAARRTILDLLKRGGAQSANDLGAVLGVTAMAVRLHLYELEAEGLVASKSEPAGRGRPVKKWSLTDAASRIFPDAHQGLAVAMIHSVEELFGKDGLEKVIDKHGDIQRTDYHEKLTDAHSLEDRVRILATVRSHEGYMAEAMEDGCDWLLIENHCPVCSAAKACTGLCANELKVFQDVLGEEVLVTREEHILSGARRCTYRVSSNDK